jgi:hypothetical protein
MMIMNGIPGEIDCDIAMMQNQIDEIFLELVAFISGTYDKVVEAIMSVNAHDMPDYRLFPDFD